MTKLRAHKSWTVMDREQTMDMGEMKAWAWVDA
jgi:hypothetical protein